jgi:hypothetical protein
MTFAGHTRLEVHQAMSTDFLLREIEHDHHEHSFVLSGVDENVLESAAFLSPNPRTTSV